MPSPIAHSAVALALWPALQPEKIRAVPRRNRWIVAGMLVAMTCGADVDFVPHLLLDNSDALRHGGATHSFAVGIAVALLFAVVAKQLVPLGWLRLWIVGCIAWWSHVVLDFFTPGGGVIAFWPLTEERFRSPVPLFFGAEHSQPLAVHLHLITLVTELPFVILMWWIGRRARRAQVSTR